MFHGRNDDFVCQCGTAAAEHPSDVRQWKVVCRGSFGFVIVTPPGDVRRNERMDERSELECMSERFPGTSLCVSQVGPYDLVACWRDGTPIKGLTSAFKALIGERKARASLTENGVTTPLFTVYLVFEK